MRLTEVLDEKMKVRKETEKEIAEKEEAAIELVKALFLYYGVKTDDLEFKAEMISYPERIRVFIRPRGFQERVGWPRPFVNVDFNSLPKLDGVFSELTDPRRYRREDQCRTSYKLKNCQIVILWDNRRAKTFASPGAALCSSDRRADFAFFLSKFARLGFIIRFSLKKKKKGKLKKLLMEHGFRIVKVTQERIYVSLEGYDA